MAYIEFKNMNVLISASVEPMTKNVIRITSDWEPNISGFQLYLDKNKKFPMSK